MLMIFVSKRDDDERAGSAALTWRVPLQHLFHCAW
jgi:hypothetical protein